MNTKVEVTAGDLRAAIARARVPLYLVAAAARCHPVTLGLILREKKTLRPELAERVLAALRELRG